jgi:hypothetical protein
MGLIVSLVWKEEQLSGSCDPGQEATTLIHEHLLLISSLYVYLLSRHYIAFNSDEVNYELIF